MTQRRLAVVSVACLVATVAIRAWIERHGSLPGDRRWLDEVRFQPLAAWERVPTDLFSAIALAPVAFVTVAVLWRVLARRVDVATAWLMVLAAAVPIASTGMKLVLGPVPLDAVAFGADKLGSYPSGHTAYATALFGYLAIVARRRGRGGVVALCLAVVVLMGPMRVLGRVHFPSDVVGGYLLGIGWLAGVLALERSAAKS